MPCRGGREVGSHTKDYTFTLYFLDLRVRGLTRYFKGNKNRLGWGRKDFALTKLTVQKKTKRRKEVLELFDDVPSKGTYYKETDHLFTMGLSIDKNSHHPPFITFQVPYKALFVCLFCSPGFNFVPHFNHHPLRDFKEAGK
jgi:hypothetical protein